MNVFDKCTIGNVTLNNRFVRSATAGPFSPGGKISEAGLRRYAELAKNHVGLIITEMAYVSEDGKASRSCMSITSDADVEQHTMVAKTIHDNGSKVFLQINHGGAAALVDNPPSPSGLPSPYTNAPTIEISEEDIIRITRDFADAAVRAVKAGYDGVQVQCAHGWLISQFIDPAFNKRQDKYGGNAQGRFLFAEEIIRAIKEAVGEEFPVCIKINSNLAEGDDAYEADLLYFAEKCAELGVCCIELSGCDFTPLGRKQLHNYYLDRALKIKAQVQMPIMLIGGIRTQADIEELMEKGIDFVSMARPFLCQPDIVLRLEQGEDSKCVSCSKCFIMSRKFSEEGRLCFNHEPMSDTYKD